MGTAAQTVWRYSGEEENPEWVEVAYAGNVLSEPSVIWAETVAASEACKAAISYCKGTLHIDEATARVL